MSEEIKPVFYVDSTTLRCRTMDDISDESVLYYRRGDKVHETDVALYPESAIDFLKNRISELEKQISSQMNFGERMIIDSSGDVVGDDTGRLVAKFSHWNEAESFCEAANFKYSLSKKV